MTRLILILSLLVGLISASGAFSHQAVRSVGSLAPKPPSNKGLKTALKVSAGVTAFSYLNARYNPPSLALWNLRISPEDTPETRRKIKAKLLYEHLLNINHSIWIPGNDFKEAVDFFYQEMIKNQNDS